MGNQQDSAERPTFFIPPKRCFETSIKDDQFFHIEETWYKTLKRQLIVPEQFVFAYSHYFDDQKLMKAY